MYKRNAQGWSKHLDFFIIDEIVLHAAYVCAMLVRFGTLSYDEAQYRGLAIVLFLADAIVQMFFNTMHNVVKRNLWSELLETAKHSIMVYLAATGYMFAAQIGDTFSRLVLLYTLIIHFMAGYITRVLWKHILISVGTPGARKATMIAVLQPETAETTLKRLLGSKLESYEVVGVIINGDTDLKEVEGVPVVTTLDKAADYICREWIDSIYIDCPSTDTKIAKLMEDCRQMAIPLHYHVPGIGIYGEKQFVEKIGGTTVLTTTINYATPVQNLAKRCLDILGGIVGSILALIAIAIVGPIIKAQSPDPIIFKQERIGQNGKRFYIYKIRSMYMDAEERKKELMAQNRVSDGMMFKMDFDPRIIGNKILPDGTKKTGIGEFIRKYSIDELPQFFCCILSTMSLVGTRPPTPDEWEKYAYHHRARLACKPGITGMWQVSGRSEITNFEQVVKLDTEYITNWSFALDIKILFKTIWVVYARKGAM